MLFIFSIYVRVQYLGMRRDFWHDESFQYLYSLKPISFILNGNDVHPPLFNLVAKVIIKIVGNNVTLLRFLGASLFSVLFILVVYVLVREMFSKQAAFFTGLVLSVSLTFIQYSAEFRNYSWTLFFVAAQILYFNRWLVYRKLSHSVGYIALSLIMVYSHYLAGLVLLVQILYIILLRWRNLLPAKSLLSYFSCLSIIGYLSIPLAYYTVLMSQKVGTFWFKNINFYSLLSTFLYIITPPLSQPIGTATALYGITLYGVWHYRKDLNRFHIQMAMYLVIPILLMWTLSVTVLQFYHHRYFIFGAIGLFVVFGWVLSKIEESESELGWIAFGTYALLCGAAFTHGFAPDHTIADSTDALKAYAGNTSYITVHSSQFSGAPFRVYIPDHEHYLLTNFTEREMYAAGGSIWNESMKVHSLSELPNITTYWVSDRLMSGKIIFNQGGLYVVKI